MVEKPAVLVVDDEYLLVYSISDYLAREGFAVQSTTSPEEALALLDKERFDIVITDLRMMPLSGVEIIKKLRSSDFGGKIIVMSAYFTEFEKELRDLNVDALLEKPFKLDELLRVLGAVR